MKTLLFFCVLTLASTSFASTCEDDFNQGVESHKRIQPYAKMGVADYDRYLEDFNSGDPNESYYCEKLASARMYMWLSLQSVIKANKYFNRAYVSCNSPNDRTAKQNVEYTKKQYQLVLEKFTEYQDELLENCDDAQELPEVVKEL